MQSPLQTDEHQDVIAQGIRSAVSRGMDSPYRDAIVSGIEEGGEEVTGTSASGGRRRTLGIGLSTAFLLVGAIYLARRKMGGD